MLLAAVVLLSAVHVVRRIVRNRSAVLAAASPAHRRSFPSLIINGCCRRRGGGLRWLCAFERGGDGGAELHTRSELTPYQVLGVPRHATDQYIRAAYRELVRKLHPDRGGPEASAAAMAAAAPSRSPSSPASSATRTTCTSVRRPLRSFAASGPAAAG